MKRLMLGALLAAALCCGTQANAQNTANGRGNNPQFQNNGQRPPMNGDFCPCPCCRKDMPKDSKNNKNGDKNFPPQDQNMRPGGENSNGQNSNMRRPPMSAENCKCGSKCKKCDCNNSSSKKSSKKSKKNKKSKSGKKQVDGVTSSTPQARG